MLPPPSTTMTRVLNAVSDPDLSAAELGQLIASDAALAAELLRTANSAYYGISVPVTSVKHAVIMLGIRRALSLAVGVAALSSMERVKFPRGFDHRGLWSHLHATAVASGWLAEREHPENKDVAHIAGLLHDIGKALLAVAQTNEWRRVHEIVESRGISYEEAEHEVEEAAHAEIGAELLEHWRLPPQLQQIVRGHHAPQNIEGVDGELARVVRTADAVARIAGIGNPGDHVVPTLEQAASLSNGAETPDEIERLAMRLRWTLAVYVVPDRHEGAKA